MVKALGGNFSLWGPRYLEPRSQYELAIVHCDLRSTVDSPWENLDRNRCLADKFRRIVLTNAQAIQRLLDPLFRGLYDVFMLNLMRGIDEQMNSTEKSRGVSEFMKTYTTTKE